MNHVKIDDLAFLTSHAAAIQAMSFVCAATVSLPATATAVLLNTIGMAILFPVEQRINGQGFTPVGRFIILEVLNGCTSAVSALATGAIFGLGGPATWAVAGGSLFFATVFVIFNSTLMPRQVYED